MGPDPATIIDALSIGEAVIGFYDAPDPAPFAPLIEPSGTHKCVFASYARWCEGKTLHVTEHLHGCGASHLLGPTSRSREEIVRLLVDEEGLRASHELMDQWLDATPGYEPRYGHLLIGPLCADQYEYLRSVTFYVNTEQLAVLVTGSSYYRRPNDAPVVAPLNPGCWQLASVFSDLDAPQAVVGATGRALRQQLDPGLLTFTVTKSMFELLCRWAGDPTSSLHSVHLKKVITTCGGSF